MMPNTQRSYSARVQVTAEDKILQRTRQSVLHFAWMLKNSCKLHDDVITDNSNSIELNNWITKLSQQINKKNDG